METNLLTKPFAEFDVSHAFRKQCGEMGFYNLKQIIDTSLPAILIHDKFSYSWLGELTALLSAHGLLALLQPIPGNKYG